MYIYIYIYILPCIDMFVRMQCACKQTPSRENHTMDQHACEQQRKFPKVLTMWCATRVLLLTAPGFGFYPDKQRPDIASRAQ